MLHRNVRLNLWKKYGILLLSQVHLFVSKASCVIVPQYFHNYLIGIVFYASILNTLPARLNDQLSPAAFLFYAALVIAVVLILIFHYIPQFGQTHIMFYISVCSLVGSLSVGNVIFDEISSIRSLAAWKYLRWFCMNLTLWRIIWQVMSVKALGIALKVTLSGMNQLIYPQTWTFALVVTVCVLTQMNYLNKVKNVSEFMIISLPWWWIVKLALNLHFNFCR